MIKHTTVLYLVICSLLVIIFTQRCAVDKNMYQKVPSVEGTLKDTLPLVTDTIRMSDRKLKEEIKKIVIEKELESQEKVKEFENKPKEVKKELYKKAVEVKTYQNKVEDENIKIEYTAITSGTLDFITFDYKIKERTIEKEKPKNHLYLGGSLNTNINSDRYALNATIGLQNKKGDILTASYGTDKSITVGYLFRLF